MIKPLLAGFALALLIVAPSRADSLQDCLTKALKNLHSAQIAEGAKLQKAELNCQNNGLCIKRVREAGAAALRKANMSHINAVALCKMDPDRQGTISHAGEQLG